VTQRGASSAPQETQRGALETGYSSTHNYYVDRLSHLTVLKRWKLLSSLRYVAIDLLPGSELSSRNWRSRLHNILTHPDNVQKIQTTNTCHGYMVRIRSQSESKQPKYRTIIYVLCHRVHIIRRTGVSSIFGAQFLFSDLERHAIWNKKSENGSREVYGAVFLPDPILAQIYDGPV
jgi:hypothetical protein